MNFKDMTLEELNAIAAADYTKLEEINARLFVVNNQRRLREKRLSEKSIDSLTDEQKVARKKNSRSIGSL